LEVLKTSLNLIAWADGIVIRSLKETLDRENTTLKTWVRLLHR